MLRRNWLGEVHLPTAKVVFMVGQYARLNAPNQQLCACTRPPCFKFGRVRNWRSGPPGLHHDARPLISAELWPVSKTYE